MSQTLALIVAASVLMMTALTVIFMVQGGLGDVNQDTSRQSCLGALRGICAGTNGQVATPGSCTSDGAPIPNLDAGSYGITASTTQCSTFNSAFE